MKINLITPPDKIYQDTTCLLLINPDKQVFQDMQDVVLPEINQDLNIFIYDDSQDNTDLKWLMDTFHYSDIVLIDVDNSSPVTRDLFSYMISKNKTYWLTKSQNTVYSILSNQQVYNLESLIKIIGDNSEKEL